MSNLVVEDLSTPDRWREDFIVSLAMLREAGIGICRPDSAQRLEPLDILWKGRDIKLPDGEVARIHHVAGDSDRRCRQLIITTEDGARHEMPFGDLEGMLVRPAE
jgi:hypothetical protein